MNEGEGKGGIDTSEVDGGGWDILDWSEEGQGGNEKERRASGWEQPDC